MIKQLLRLWNHLSKLRRRQFLLLLIWLLAASAVEMASIGAVVPFLGAMLGPEQFMHKPFMVPFINLFGLKRPSELLLPLTVIFCAAVVLSGALRFGLLRAQTRLSHEVGADISTSIYRRTLYQPYITHLMRNSSDLISGITIKANNVVHLALLPAFGIVTSAVMVGAILIVLMMINAAIALTCLMSLAGIYVCVIWFVRRRLAQSSERISIESSRVVRALQEGIGGIRDVSIDGTQEFYCEIYKGADVPLRSAYANVALITNAPRFGVESLALCVVAILAYIQAGQPGGLIAAMPVIGAFALGAQRLLPISHQAYSAWSSIKGFEHSLGDALDLLDQPVLQGSQSTEIALPFDYSIKLNDVSFRYTDYGNPVLKNLTLEIKKGARIGFIGATGSGKSTLIDLIMGLLNPDNGGIFVDGIRIDNLNSKSWQKHISHVPQDIFLTDATIAENIAFGVEPKDIDYSRVRVAARRAQIGLDIESWTSKYQTIVGERGVRLSGGQRQRIAIARAFYKDTDVIVLDEATSALDTVTEEAVMHSISQLEKRVTLLVIAHRISTLKNCDLIVELSRGEIKRVVGYKELVSNNIN